ncbi:Structural maintenance of chromosomes protein 1 [Puccinia graminis f. sp. tritici]|uniref:Structural maintenance of chromosomes protein 1 n=1 Tax=Puccinia graminis f. sp. tritici TaxID=56615 RepID=A0A5B0ML81_PUCGR|nr:Structural maintenance of chromosomes protein 1 [Puccinia graminis f. sp. tritici]
MYVISINHYTHPDKAELPLNLPAADPNILMLSSAPMALSDPPNYAQLNSKIWTTKLVDCAPHEQLRKHLSRPIILITGMVNSIGFPEQSIPSPQSSQTVSSNKSGSSIYTVKKKIVNLEDYVATLESHNILVKAKKFLIFQGDVEALAGQNPKSLSKWIDQISGVVIICLFSTNLNHPRDLIFVFLSCKALWN